MEGSGDSFLNTQAVLPAHVLERIRQANERLDSLAKLDHETIDDTLFGPLLKTPPSSDDKTAREIKNALGNHEEFLYLFRNGVHLLGIQRSPLFSNECGLISQASTTGTRPIKLNRNQKGSQNKAYATKCVSNPSQTDDKHAESEKHSTVEAGSSDAGTEASALHSEVPSKKPWLEDGWKWSKTITNPINLTQESSVQAKDETEISREHDTNTKSNKLGVPSSVSAIDTATSSANKLSGSKDPILNLKVPLADTSEELGKEVHANVTVTETKNINSNESDQCTFRRIIPVHRLHQSHQFVRFGPPSRYRIWSAPLTVPNRQASFHSWRKRPWVSETTTFDNKESQAPKRPSVESGSSSGNEMNPSNVNLNNSTGEIITEKISNTAASSINKSSPLPIKPQSNPILNVDVPSLVGEYCTTQQGNNQCGKTSDTTWTGNSVEGILNNTVVGKRDQVLTSVSESNNKSPERIQSSRQGMSGDATNYPVPRNYHANVRDNWRDVLPIQLQIHPKISGEHNIMSSVGNFVPQQSTKVDSSDLIKDSMTTILKPQTMDITHDSNILKSVSKDNSNESSSNLSGPQILPNQDGGVGRDIWNLRPKYEFQPNTVHFHLHQNLMQNYIPPRNPAIVNTAQPGPCPKTANQPWPIRPTSENNKGWESSTPILLQPNPCPVVKYRPGNSIPVPVRTRHPNAANVNAWIHEGKIWRNCAPNQFPPHPRRILRFRAPKQVDGISKPQSIIGQDATVPSTPWQGNYRPVLWRNYNTIPYKFQLNPGLQFNDQKPTVSENPSLPCQSQDKGRIWERRETTDASVSETNVAPN